MIVKTFLSPLLSSVESLPIITLSAKLWNTSAVHYTFTLMDKTITEKSLITKLNFRYWTFLLTVNNLNRSLQDSRKWMNLSLSLSIGFLKNSLISLWKKIEHQLTSTKGHSLILLRKLCYSCKVILEMSLMKIFHW